MTGWMLTEQADLFGLGMDALTSEQVAKLLEEADRAVETAGHDLAGDDESDTEEPAELEEPSYFEEDAGLGEDFGVLVQRAANLGGDAAERWSAGQGADTDYGPVPTARDYEFVCAGCFLIWHRQLLGDASRRLCRDCAEDMALIRRRAARACLGLDLPMAFGPGPPHGGPARLRHGLVAFSHPSRRAA